MEFKHKSVLLEETIEGLDIKPDGIYVDGTLGGAGHAGEVCRKLSAKGRFIGIDQDQDAIITFRNSQYTRFRRSPNKTILIFADRSHLPHGNSIHRINIIKLHIRSIYIKNRKEKKEYKQS